MAELVKQEEVLKQFLDTNEIQIQNSMINMMDASNSVIREEDDGLVHLDSRMIND